MSSNLLQKRSFWYSFVILVILSLFLYGLKLDNDISLIEQLKKDLEESNRNLTKSQKLVIDYKNEINNINTLILKKNETISEQRHEINRLNNLLNPYHEFGKNKGKLIIYTSCKNGGKTKVTINGKFKGNLTRYFINGSPDCYGSRYGSVISEIVIAGSHHIKAEDENGRTWDFYVIINEDQCLKQGLCCE